MKRQQPLQLQEAKRPKFGQHLRYKPQAYDINLPELSRTDFLKEQPLNDISDLQLLRSLLREIKKSLDLMRHSDLLIRYNDELERISASKHPDYSRVKKISEDLKDIITIQHFVPRHKTNEDYEMYLADVNEQKMNIRKLLRMQ
jgi:hypothetical protein